MSNLLIHNMETAWTSLSPAVLQVSLDNQEFAEGAASNRFIAQTGSMNAIAEFISAAPLNLNDYEELRFWIRSNRPAEGSTAKPFYLEFSYVDADDMVGEEHRWFVPVNQVGRWEHRRIGIENDRRGAITSFRLRCLTDLPFVCYLDELLAVRDEMLPDAEQALIDRLDNQVTLPGLTAILLNQTANPGDTQIVLPFTPAFSTGNRIRVQGGGAGDEFHSVFGVTHDQGAGTTTLDLDVNDPVAGTLNAGVAGVSVLVPINVESPPVTTAPSTPGIIATALDAREDFERTAYITQRDSFRPRGNLTTCSVRPAARAYLLDYQITAVAPDRAQQLRVQNMLMQRLSMDIALRINGVPSPLWILPPPALEKRELGLLAPVYLRIGTRMETAPRQELPFVRQAEIGSALKDAPLDQEGIVITI